MPDKMTRTRYSFLIGVIALLLLGMAWASWMAYVNTRTTALTMRINGVLDEVSIYSTRDAKNPVATIHPEGQAVSQVVRLRQTQGFSLWRQRPPAKYYFVAQRDGRTMTSRTMGFGARRRVILEILDIDDYRSS